MHKLAAAILSLGLLAAAVPFTGSAQATTEPVRFGMDASSVGAQTGAGIKPDFGTFWVGPWTLSSGWAGPDGQMDAMSRAGVTPAIHFYYWGDDISVNCVENGCWSNLHNAQKTPEKWQLLAEQLVAHLKARMGGREVVIFMESEFNKGNVATYEPLDGYLAEKTRFIKQGYPNAKVVMSLGNWNSAAWGTWDRTAAASDYTGIQAMRGSTRDSVTYYDGVYDTVLAGAKTLQSKFHKPIMIQDVALSSYPEPDYLGRQAETLGDFFEGMPALKAAGVKGLIYRSWGDSPRMDLANYYGQAERHWGLAQAASEGGAWKPAAKVWVDGVKAERNGSPVAAFSSGVDGLTASFDASGSRDPNGDPLSFAWSFGDGAKATGAKATHSYASGGTFTVTLTVSDGGRADTETKTVTVSRGTSTTTTYAPTFQLGSGVNSWWVEVKVSPTAAKVEAKVNSGSWVTLSKTSWGTWAKSFYVAKGSAVTFRATDSSGQAATSAPYSWLSSSSSTTPGFTATFTPKGTANNWWVETTVKASDPISKVEARVNGGAWTVLPKTSWGTYAKSMNVKDHSVVEFRATSTTGATAMSQKVTWI